jgi:hypothetical protein
MIWPLSRRRALILDDAVIESLCAHQPWLHRLNVADRLRLLALMADFLTTKTVTGAQGLAVDDAMRLSIAAQACLPVLNLSLDHYGPFNEIVVHPGAFEVHRTLTDETGLVTEFDDVLAGESMEGGPVVLSWADVQGSAHTRPDPPLNVVIHEFAHKLDLADGQADGCPPMPRTLANRFRPALYAAYEAFCRQLDDIEDALPPDLDPESDEAAPWFAALPLDPYAATDEAEFFAVACEAFFTDDGGFAAAYPDLNDCFVAYFRHDPNGCRPL